MPVTGAPKPKPVSSKRTWRARNLNNLTIDRELIAVPIDPRYSSDLAVDSPDLPAFFRS